VKMVIECCSQERSYSTFYGLVGERFCRLNRVWFDCFETAFGTYYDTVHRYETNRLRNIARFFGHLLASDAISWNAMGCVKLTEEDTTSSSRIFVKIMLTEMQESMGLKVLKERFADEEVKSVCAGMFPLDNPKNTRFAINYFTSIGLGAITEEMREHLKVCNPYLNDKPNLADDHFGQNAPRLIMEQRRALEAAEGSSSSDSDSDSDDSSSEDSSGSDSGSSVHSRRKSRRRSSTPPRSRRHRGDDLKTPPRRRGGSRDGSRNRRSPAGDKNGDRARGVDRDYGRSGSGRRHRERTRSPPSSRSRSPARRSRTPPRRYQRESGGDGDRRDDHRRR
jgi:pre-mRNA-splicing factor CWC22